MGWMEVGFVEGAGGGVRFEGTGIEIKYFDLRGEHFTRVFF